MVDLVCKSPGPGTLGYVLQVCMLISVKCLKYRISLLSSFMTELIFFSWGNFGKLCFSRNLSIFSYQIYWCKSIHDILMLSFEFLLPFSFLMFIYAWFLHSLELVLSEVCWFHWCSFKKMNCCLRFIFLFVIIELSSSEEKDLWKYSRVVLSCCSKKIMCSVQ